MYISTKMSIDNTDDQHNGTDDHKNTAVYQNTTIQNNDDEISEVENKLGFENDIHNNSIQDLVEEGRKMAESKENGFSMNGDENNGSFVIRNNLYPSACSNTVTLTSVSTKKPNVTSIEMRSSGTVPKKADIHNYLSSATLLVGKK